LAIREMIDNWIHTVQLQYNSRVNPNLDSNLDLFPYSGSQKNY